jgi:hypothetical protein
VETRAVDAGRAQGDPRLEGNSRIYLSEIAYLAQDFASAEKEARASAEILTAVPSLRAVALAGQARALIELKRPKEAEEKAKEAMGLLDDLGGIEEGESLVRLSFAEALDARGDRESARRAIGTARDRLHVRGSRITEPTWRESFLRQVPENARTLALAEEWGC